MRRIGAGLLSLAAFLAVWKLATLVGGYPDYILPPPDAVAERGIRAVGSGLLWEHTAVTLLEIVLGFALGGSVGFGLGLLLGSSLRLRTAYLPLLSALEAVPTVILAPLLIAWFGFGLDGKVVQAAIACFYAVFITTLSGLELAEPEAITLMRSLRASTWQILRKVKVPSALPAIFGGLYLGATTAIIGGIVSEFVGADLGLGFLLLRYRSSFDTPAAWVLIFTFLVIGLVAYGIIWAIERKVVFWRRSEVVRADLDQP